MLPGDGFCAVSVPVFQVVLPVVCLEDGCTWWQFFASKACLMVYLRQGVLHGSGMSADRASDVAISYFNGYSCIMLCGHKHGCDTLSAWDEGGESGLGSRV